MTETRLQFGAFLKPNKRPYLLGPAEDADLVGMRLYGLGPFHRELKSADKIRKKTHFVIHENDVIYNKLFAWKGSFGIVSADLDGMYVSDKFPTYELDGSQIDQRYLKWYFHCPELWSKAERVSTGSAAISKLTLNPPRFLELTIPAPPLEEQRRIVRVVDRMATRIAEAQGIRSSISAQTDALFLSYVDTLAKKCFGEFESKQLIDCVDANRGISYGIVQTGKPFPSGVPTLRAGDLRQCQVNTTDIKEVDPSIEAGFRRTRLEGAEVLLRIRGGYGEVAVCPPEMVGGNVSREIAVIPVIADELDSEFVMFMIAAPSSQDFLRSHVRGTAYVGLNLRDVRRLVIPTPPIDRQKRVVSALKRSWSQLSEFKHIQKGTSAHLDALLPSILAKAFKGEL